MVRKSTELDIDAIMPIWLDINIKAHNFISSQYWRSRFDMVKEMLPHAEIYVHEDDCTNQIDGFIGVNNDYIEGLFVKEVAQSKGIGKQLLNYVKDVKSSLSLSVYKKNERAIKFYISEGFKTQSENVDDNTGEKEFLMIWNR